MSDHSGLTRAESNAKYMADPKLLDAFWIVSGITYDGCTSWCMLVVTGQMGMGQAILDISEAASDENGDNIERWEIL